MAHARDELALGAAGGLGALARLLGALELQVLREVLDHGHHVLHAPAVVAQRRARNAHGKRLAIAAPQAQLAAHELDLRGEQVLVIAHQGRQVFGDGGAGDGVAEQAFGGAAEHLKQVRVALQQLAVWIEEGDAQWRVVKDAAQPRFTRRALAFDRAALVDLAPQVGGGGIDGALRAQGMPGDGEQPGAEHRGRRKSGHGEQPAQRGLVGGRPHCAQHAQLQGPVGKLKSAFEAMLIVEGGADARGRARQQRAAGPWVGVDEAPRPLRPRQLGQTGQQRLRAQRDE